MAEINWGALQTPDFVGNALKAQDMGQEQRLVSAKQNALKQYSTDPEGAISSLMAIDPVAATQLRKLLKDERAEKIRTSVSTKYAAGDATGARTEALGAGEFDLAKSISELDADSRKQAQERAGVLASIAQSVRAVPYDQRRARLTAMRGQVAALGIQPEQLDAFDPTDEAIDGQIAQAMDIKEMLAEADRRADNARADAKDKQDAEFARQRIGISRDQANVAQAGLGLRREQHRARLAAGGYGTPGLGLAAIPDDEVDLD